MDDNRPTRLTRRGFLAGTIAAALAACSDGGRADRIDHHLRHTGTTTIPPSTDDDHADHDRGSADHLAGDDDQHDRPDTGHVRSVLARGGVGRSARRLGDPVDPSAAGRAVARHRHRRRVGRRHRSGDDRHRRQRVGVRDRRPRAFGPRRRDGGSSPTPSTTTGSASATSRSTPARTHTFAAAGTTPEQFRFAFSSCQNWEQGYYAAYRDLVEQGGIDAFVFLGDYIYEYASGGYADERGRTHGPGFRVRDGRSVPPALRPVPERPVAAGRPRARAVDHHVGRPRGRQRLRRRQQRGGRRAPRRSWPVAPPATRSGTSTCRCGSTRRAAPTTRSTARSPTATCCGSTCSTRGSTGPTSSAAARSSR